jgi:hypothetical protein
MQLEDAARAKLTCKSVDADQLVLATAYVACMLLLAEGVGQVNADRLSQAFANLLRQEVTSGQ